MRWSPVWALSVACVVAGCGCPETRPGDFPDEAAMRVSVSSEPDAAPSFECEGIGEPSADACSGRGDLLMWCTWCGEEGRLAARTAVALFGYSYALDLEAREGGRARLCRSYTNDVDDGECWPGYECAVSGEVVLTSGGGATVHAVFEGGRTIDAAIAPPTAM